MKTKKIVFITIIGLIVSFGYYFLNSMYNVTIPCIFYKVTGFYCPGCGITRLVFALLNGDIYQAFRYNPLIFSLGLGLIVYLLIKYVVLFKIKNEIKMNNKIIYILLIITIIFGILRNIPFFDFLAPTIV